MREEYAKSEGDEELMGKNLRQVTLHFEQGRPRFSPPRVSRPHVESFCASEVGRVLLQKIKTEKDLPSRYLCGDSDFLEDDLGEGRRDAKIRFKVHKA